MDLNAVVWLTSIGFKPAGEWHLENDKPRCRIDDCGALSQILYAFVIDGQVMYIGKSIRTLRQRMYNYMNPGPTQPTNIANNARIAEALRANKTIHLYVFQPDPSTYQGIPLNLAAGLEDGLIAAFKPPWNGSTKQLELGLKLSVNEQD